MNNNVNYSQNKVEVDLLPPNSDHVTIQLCNLPHATDCMVVCTKKNCYPPPPSSNECHRMIWIQWVATRKLTRSPNPSFRAKVFWTTTLVASVEKVHSVDQDIFPSSILRRVGKTLFIKETFVFGQLPTLEGETEVPKLFCGCYRHKV